MLPIRAQAGRYIKIEQRVSKRGVKPRDWNKVVEIDDSHVVNAVMRVLL